MRARYPDLEDFVEVDGVKIGLEVYDNSGPTILLLPTWSIIHARQWKAQIPYLSRHYRVVTFDPRGNGRTDRPDDVAAYDEQRFVDDAIAVMHATSTQSAFVVGFSMGARFAVLLADQQPAKVDGVIMLGPAIASTADEPDWWDRGSHPFDADLDVYEGWDKYNETYWRKDYPAFVEFFFANVFSEPHSTKQIEDTVRWALSGDGEMLINTVTSEAHPDEGIRAAMARLDCPALMVHGGDDRIIWVGHARQNNADYDIPLVELEGTGHSVHGREPVKTNHLIRQFVDMHSATRSADETLRPHLWARGLGRRKRALFVSSPIGLGHARRDASIAAELHRLEPELEIDWLAQHPVTLVLEEENYRIHPASDHLASESAHIRSESDGHDLHCFQALRRMDEILIANFMVFQEVVDEGGYDLVISDEAWDIDHFWHENPELKRTTHAWMTDFVGFIPMPAGGDHEAALTADYNAEMIEHVARYPRVRDTAIFVGNPEDIVDASFGPGLPMIRDWTEQHFTFTGYATGFDPGSLDRDELRDELGFGADETVCIVTVGGAGVGSDLLARVINAYPLASKSTPGLRMIVVAGPRIDPTSLPSVDGVEVLSYVDRLYRHLAASDVAVVQGGLTTTMELVASRRPFLYFPLRNHFEQNYHVRHRLDRYGAGRHMEFADTDAEAIAAAITDELASPVNYRPVETDGASRAAEQIATLL